MDVSTLRSLEGAAIRISPTIELIVASFESLDPEGCYWCGDYRCDGTSCLDAQRYFNDQYVFCYVCGQPDCDGECAEIVILKKRKPA